MPARASSANLAVEWGWCDDNPAQKFFRRTETPRERFLTREEIGSLAAALDAAEDRRAADIIRMCMLTGARLGEVRQAQFDQFNLEQLSWAKPPTMTKQRRVHRVPISEETANIVRQRHLLVPRGTPWLFPGDTAGHLRGCRVRKVALVIVARNIETKRFPRGHGLDLISFLAYKIPDVHRAPKENPA